MNIRISGYTDDPFGNISSSLHSAEQFTACATELVEAMERSGMRSCEAATLLEQLLQTVYFFSGGDSHSDVQLYKVKAFLVRKNAENQYR